MNCPLLHSIKNALLNAVSQPLQTLGINVRPAPNNYRRTRPYRGPLTQTPQDRPGKVLLLPKTCGVCGSSLVGYDPLNVVTCDTCDSLLSVSGRWHKPHGNIRALTSEDQHRARTFGGQAS